MTYNKTNWQNNSTPAINETNLNKIEEGIKNATTVLTQAEITSVINSINIVGDTVEPLPPPPLPPEYEQLVTKVYEINGLVNIHDTNLNVINGNMNSLIPDNANNIVNINNLLNRATTLETNKLNVADYMSNADVQNTINQFVVN